MSGEIYSQKNVALTFMIFVIIKGLFILGFIFPQILSGIKSSFFYVIFCLVDAFLVGFFIGYILHVQNNKKEGSNVEN